MITDSSLINLQGLASLFHLVQSGYTFGLSNSVFKDKAQFTVTNSQTQLPAYNLGNIVGAFPLLAAIDHGWSYINRTKYLDMVNTGYNPVRWTEYGTSAGLMLFVISQLSGIKDIKLLTLLLGSNVVLQYFGYTTERNTAQNNPEQAISDNRTAFFLFISTWVPLFVAFFTSLQESEKKPPEVVYIIIFVMFFLFLIFGLVNLAYIRGKRQKQDKWRSLSVSNFRNIEVGYLILSFVAKTLLTNLTLFGGVNKPPDDQT
jgi:hypothetical protein